MAMEGREAEALAGPEAALGVFCEQGFEARSFVNRYYETHSAAQAKALCITLMEEKGKAGQQLQRKVFRHYPRFIESADELRAMEADLTRLRRTLGKTEFVLSGIETAAARLAKLPGAGAGASAAQSQEAELASRLTETAAEASAQPDEAVGLLAALERSRFKKAQALLGGEDFDQRWLLEAPSQLELLLHFGAFDAAVALIRRVDETPATPPPKQEEEQEQQEQQAGASSLYMRQEREWALRFARVLVAGEAAKLVETLIETLENDSGLQSRPATRNRPRSGSVDQQQNEGANGAAAHEAGDSPARASSPVVYLQRLGLEETACRTFLAGKRKHLKELCDEVIYSPLATEPEQCVLELAQRVFRCILDTNMQFRQLFNAQPGIRDDEQETHPDSLFSCLVVWTRDEVARYVTNFVRFLLPGCSMLEEAGVIQLVGAQGAEAPFEPGPDEDDVTPLGMKGIPFLSERRGVDTFLLLSNDEWRVLGSCLRWTLLLCKRLEKEGLPLNFVIARQLRRPLDVALESIFVHLERNVRLHLTREAWQTEQLQVESREAASKCVLSLTTSGQKLYELVHDLIRKVKRIYSTSYSTATASLEATIVARLVSILRTYLENLVHACGAHPAALGDSHDKYDKFEDLVRSQARRGESYQGICAALRQAGATPGYRERRVVTVLMSEPFSQAQTLGMIADALFVGEDLVPRVRENIEKLFRRKLPAMRALERDYADMENENGPLRHLCDAFVKRTSMSLLEDVLQWSHFDYSSTPKGSAKVSPNFERLGQAVAELKTKATHHLGEHSCALDIVASITEHVLVKLEAGGMPSAIFGPVEGAENKQRLSTDLHLLVNLPQTLMDREPSEHATEIVDMILKKTGAAS